SPTAGPPVRRQGLPQPAEPEDHPPQPAGGVRGDGGQREEAVRLLRGEVRDGHPTDPGEGTVERGSHTALHRWVGDPRQPSGEDMGNFYSAGREPIFFSHHANIDRLWSVYRDLRARMGRPRQFRRREWLDANFVFYDENGKLVRVRVADTLENERMGYTFQKVDLPWLRYREERVRDKKSKPKLKNKAAAVRSFVASDNPAFPVKLDKVSRSKKDKEKEEELLVIEGIEVDTAKFVRFEVYINDEDDKPDEVEDKAEYAGCYSQVPHRSSGEVMKTKIRLGLAEVLEDLDADDDDQVLVSLVPQAGGEDVTIGGVKIIYDDVDDD
ncbi:polyphenol oxidase ii chloroplastic, partial [Phtheirospermum japonicum]